MIPEWFSFRNECHSRMKLVVHSYHKFHWFGLFLRAWFLHHIRYPCATYPRLHTLFTIQNEVRFQFTWYQNEISYQNKNLNRYRKIILRWGELVPERKSFWYHVNSPLLTIQTVHSPLFFCTIVRIKFQMYRFKFTLGAGDGWEEARTIFNKFYQ